MQLAHSVGEQVREWTQTYKSGLFNNCKTTFISSPFIRTLQTCVFFGCGLTGQSQIPIVTNNNIVVKLGSSSSSVFQKGILATTKFEKLNSQWLDGRLSAIQSDSGQAVLFKTNGTHKETSCKDRYLVGFTDILQRKMATLSETEVVILLSHSDGINSFLKSVGCTSIKLDDPDYCTTIAVKVDKTADGFKVDDVQVLRK